MLSDPVAFISTCSAIGWLCRLKDGPVGFVIYDVSVIEIYPFDSLHSESSNCEQHADHRRNNDQGNLLRRAELCAHKDYQLRRQDYRYQPREMLLLFPDSIMMTLPNLVRQI